MEELNNCDYKIITIDSDYAFYPSADYCDFYIKLDEALKNVYKSNIITMLLSIPNNSSLKTPLNRREWYVNHVFYLKKVYANF